MVMVSSAVLGAAAGTGLALILAVTIVMYRYYLLRKRGKEWDELDRWEETRIMRKLQMKVGGWWVTQYVDVDVTAARTAKDTPWGCKFKADTTRPKQRLTWGDQAKKIT